MYRKRALILGLGVSGFSVARYLHSQGYYVVGIDCRRQSSDYCHQIYNTNEDLEKLGGDFDIVIRSPGISLSHSWIQILDKYQIPRYTEVDIAFRALVNSKHPILAVTGANGKTTTVLFLQHLLKILGVNAITAGNIGTPLIDTLHFDGVHIVELSSFQLMDVQHAYPILDGALLLNLSDNHLDVHKTKNAYREAKEKIIHYLKDNAILWSNQDFSVGTLYCEHIDYLKQVLDPICHTHDLYKHDIENYVAAYCLVNRFENISQEDFLEAVLTFQKPPHRLEMVAEIDGVRYINDSKSTSVDAVRKAIIAIKGTMIVILGGKNKGGDFSLLIPLLSDKVKHVIAIGESRCEIERLLTDYVKVSLVENIKQAVLLARSLAAPNESILLSPGCSSFDQFLNFEERGQEFVNIIKGLKENCLL